MAASDHVLRGVITLTLLIAAVIWYQLTGLENLSIDDSYITLHNAKVLLSGGIDPSYGDVSPFMGATSAVHLLLLAAFGSVLPLVTASWLLNWLGAWLFALGVFQLARGSQVNQGFSLLLALLAVISGVNIHQFLNGLETSLALAGFTWAIALALPSPSRARLGTLGLICGTLPFLRPELALASGLIGLLVLFRALRGQREQLASTLVTFGAMALLGAAPWCIAYWIATGLPWPATVGAKRAFFAEGCLPLATKWHHFGNGINQFIRQVGVWSLVCVFLPLTLLGRSLSLFLGGFLLAYWIQFPGALVHYDSRYAALLFPILILGLIIALKDERPTIKYAGLGILALACLQLTFTLPESIRLHLQGRAITEEHLAPVAEWINENTAPDARLLVHDAGYVAYATERPMVDLVGLKTPSSAAFHQQYTLSSCGEDRWDAIAAIAKEAEADYLIVLNLWERHYGIAHCLNANGWTFRPGFKDKDGYSIYRISRAE